MKFRSFIFLLTFIGLSGSLQAAGIDGSSIKNMNSAQKIEFARFLTTQQCTCGCRLTVAVCLRTMKTCQHAPRMGQAKIRQLWAKRRGETPRQTNTHPQGILTGINPNPRRKTYRPTRSNPIRRSGQLNRSLFGAWKRTTNKGGFYHTGVFTFLPNGAVTYGSSASFAGVKGGSFRNPRNTGITHRGRWHVKGNIVHMRYTDGTSEWFKFETFRYDGSLVLKLNVAFYYLMSRR